MNGDTFARIANEATRAYESGYRLVFPNGRDLLWGEVPSKVGGNEGLMVLVKSEEEAEKVIAEVRGDHLAAGLGDPGLKMVRQTGAIELGISPRGVGPGVSDG